MKAKKLMTESDASGVLKYLQKIDGLIAYKLRDNETGLFYIICEKR